MPANIAPLYPLTPKMPVGKTFGANANTKSDGSGTIGTDMTLLFTAGSNGSYLEEVRCNPTASTAGTNTAATVFRLFLSSQTSGSTSSSNTSLISEIGSPIQNASNSSTPTIPIIFPISGRKIEAGMSVLISSHVANAANTGWVASPSYQDY